MVRPHNHEGIIYLQPSERNFRSRYRARNGTTKGATRAYSRLYGK